MVTFAFRCNVACTFCMVEDVLDVLPGTSLEAFRAAAAEPGRLRGVRRIIFSGGEVTLSPELPRYVELARSLPGVEHVRVQTNAIRLVRRDLVRDLKAAGLDEVFVSLHAPDEALGDALLQRKGSFRAILAGLEAATAEGLALTTNTAIVAANVARLREIVELAANFGPRQIELWNYWPRADERGARDHAAPVDVVLPRLLEALEACGARGVPPVVKWFPRCLLGGWAWAQDDGQPPALIDDAYWAREPDYGCLYAGVCADAKRCSGLSDPYVARFGWEQDRLAPRRERPGDAAGTPLGDPRRSLLRDDTRTRAENAALAGWLARRGLVPDRAVAGLHLCAASRAAGEIALLFARAGGAAPPVEVRLRPAGPGRGFSVRALGGREGPAPALVAALEGLFSAAEGAA